MKKILIRGGITIVAVVVIAVVVVIFSINAIAAHEIESVGTDTLGVKTSVGSVSIGILSGRTEITDLEIGNPPDYKGDFLKLGDGVLGVNLGSLLSDRIEIKEFTLQDINVNLIQRVNGSNVGTILDNASKSTSSDDDSSKDTSSSSDRKFIIDKLELKNIEIVISVQPVSDATKPSKVKIKEILVKDIGKKSNGVPLDQVMAIVVQSVVNSAIEAAPAQIPGIMLSAMRGGVGNLTHLDFGGVQLDVGKGLSDLVKNIKGGAASGGDGIGQALDGIGKGISDAIDSATGGSKKKSE